MYNHTTDFFCSLLLDNDHVVQWIRALADTSSVRYVSLVRLKIDLVIRLRNERKRNADGRFILVTRHIRFHTRCVELVILHIDSLPCTTFREDG